jgi:hypothetical protein
MLTDSSCQVRGPGPPLQGFRSCCGDPGLEKRPNLIDRVQSSRHHLPQDMEGMRQMRPHAQGYVNVCKFQSGSGSCELAAGTKLDEVALTVMSALQGGLLMAQTTRSARPLELALKHGPGPQNWIPTPDTRATALINGAARRKQLTNETVRRRDCADRRHRRVGTAARPTAVTSRVRRRPVRSHRPRRPG